MTTDICSMTGYASCQQNLVGIGLVNAEIKTVNSKFLDLYLKLPDYLASFEPIIRKIIGQKISRGKVEVSLNINFEPDYRFQNLYAQQIADYVSMYSSIQTQLATNHIATQEFSIADLIRHLNSPGSKQNCVDSSTISDLNQLISKTVHELMDNLVHGRAQEGRELTAALNNFLAEIKTTLDQLDLLLPIVQQELTNKFRQRLEDITNNFINHHSSKENINAAEFEPRLAQEVGVYLNKIDVAEELTRLKIHVESVEQTLDQGGLAGRKLDFLMQELMREANTLSAKSVNVEFRNLAINLKLYIEQMREQIQNIE